MRITSINHRLERGAVLMIVAVIGGIMAIVTASMLMLSNNSLQNAHGRADWNKAFYNAENAVVWAAQNVFDAPPAAGSAAPAPLAPRVRPVARPSLPVPEPWPRRSPERCAPRRAPRRNAGKGRQAHAHPWWRADPRRPGRGWCRSACRDAHRCGSRSHARHRPAGSSTAQDPGADRPLDRSRRRAHRHGVERR